MRLSLEMMLARWDLYGRYQHPIQKFLDSILLLEALGENEGLWCRFLF